MKPTKHDYQNIPLGDPADPECFILLGIVALGDRSNTLQLAVFAFLDPRPPRGCMRPAVGLVPLYNYQFDWPAIDRELERFRNEPDIDGNFVVNLTPEQMLSSPFAYADFKAIRDIVASKHNPIGYEPFDFIETELQRGILEKEKPRKMLNWVLRYAPWFALCGTPYQLLISELAEEEYNPRSHAVLAGIARLLTRKPGRPTEQPRLPTDMLMCWQLFYHYGTPGNGTATKTEIARFVNAALNQGCDPQNQANAEAVRKRASRFGEKKLDDYAVFRSHCIPIEEFQVPTTEMRPGDLLLLWAKSEHGILDIVAGGKQFRERIIDQPPPVLFS
jgi:hypothetical protein